MSKKTDLRGFERLKRNLPAAITAAVNRGALAARTTLSRDVATDMRLKVGTVRDKIDLEKARKADPDHAARLLVSARRVPAIEFNARGPEPSRGKGRGVTARLPGSPFRHAFIARGRWRRGVFQRTSKRQYPIRELMGPSVAHVAQKHVPSAVARFRDQVVKSLRSLLKNPELTGSIDITEDIRRGR
jgi:hypothetical protein